MMKDRQILLINTCCLSMTQKEESIQNILEMAEYKKSGQVKSVDHDRMSGTEIQTGNIR